MPLPVYEHSPSLVDPTWENLAVPEGANLVEADPTDATTLYTGIYDSRTVEVLVSRDGGTRWTHP